MTYLTLYLLGAFLSSVLVHTCCEYAGSDAKLRKTVPAWFHFVGAVVFSLAWPIVLGMCIRHVALLVGVRKRKRGMEV